ncbi:MAG: phosphotransferase, partial [Actinobacteria bacterium]|nr:phosphotransferase [Actinomycetota bacterium]
MSSSTSDFDEILNLVPRLQTRISVTELSGGLTNRNLKITTPAGNYVARISSNKSALLSIDRQSEYENSKIAASAGIGAEVYDFLPEFGLLVIGYIDGKTFGADDVGKNLKSIAESCKTLHSAAPFVSDFDMFVIQQRYQNLVKSSGFRFPKNYHNYA